LACSCLYAAGAPFCQAGADRKGNLAFSVGLMVLLMVATIATCRLSCHGCCRVSQSIPGALPPLILLMLIRWRPVFSESELCRGCRVSASLLARTSTFALVLIVARLAGNLKAVLGMFWQRRISPCCYF